MSVYQSVLEGQERAWICYVAGWAEGFRAQILSNYKSKLPKDAFFSMLNIVALVPCNCHRRAYARRLKVNAAMQVRTKKEEKTAK
jgi:hypothetical protein